jgi:ribosome-associated protein
MQKTAKPVVDSAALAQEVIAAIREKKGFDIALLDLRGLRHAVCDYFVFCSGNSDTQVKAIADSVESEVRTRLREKPWQSEGNRNGEWVLLDYINVVVHVMLPRIREYYSIEELWGDAEITRWAE